ncbi:MAG: extracellular solute-binding protein, partial [Clostridia bacterium]|nr:extracellular solute-binding protein [Clostridia bacterium]
MENNTQSKESALKKYKSLLIMGVALVLVVVLVLVLVLRPKGEEKPVGKDGALNILALDVGVGTSMLENVKKEFEKQNPDVTVKFDTESGSSGRQRIVGEMMLGPKYQKYDLIFSDTASIRQILENENGDIPEYEKGFVEITDVYNYQWEGETEPIKNKLQDAVLNFCNIDEKYYFMHYGVNQYGFVYNADYLQGKTLPVTTTEFFALLEDLKSESYAPLYFSTDSKANYFDYIWFVWWAQYEGVAQVENYFEGKDASGVYTPDIFKQMGRYYAYELCEKILKPENGYAESNENFITAQTHFMDGEAAIMANGTWIENEMKKQYKDGFPYKYDMMRVPVISEIIEKCPVGDFADKEYANLNATELAAADAELAALIRAIDADSTALTGEGYSVSQTTFDIVSEARSVAYMAGEMNYGVIPAAAKYPENAKKFLKFLYSNEGIELYHEQPTGMVLPLKNYDFSNNQTIQTNYTKLQKSTYETLFKSTLVRTVSGTKLEVPMRL